MKTEYDDLKIEVVSEVCIERWSLTPPEHHECDPAGDITLALKEIALGRKDCGRPLAAEVARQKAREVLARHGIGWAEVRKS